MTDRKPKIRKSNSNVSSSSSSSTCSFSSDEETDARDLKPIRGYLSNRRELARQLFKSVKTDKIRMMLPQILKNMNLNDLEEWCASELCGMSEARIISIVNGQPMLDSSDTSETDDSGPSLEIISDTEEWLTDTDAPMKEEPSSSGGTKSKKIKGNKSKSKNPTGKRNDIDKTRANVRGKTNNVPVTEADVKVKKEKEKDCHATSNKEGESLLDLLELEMRARAIRALIRKEEDIIPSAASEKRMALTANALRNTLNSAVSASLSSEKTLNGKFSLDETAANNIDKSLLNETSHGEKPVENVDDEDVVFVVAQPTPTIELLSSDNDEENGNESKKEKKTDSASATPTENTNLRQKNDKSPEIVPGRENSITSNERIVTIDKTGDGPDNLKIVITKRISESVNSPSPSKLSKLKKNSIEIGEKIVNEKACEKAVTETEQSCKGLFKKIKKKQHLRSKRKTTIEDSNIDENTVEKSSEGASTVINETEKFLESTVHTVTEVKPADSIENKITESAKVSDVMVVKSETTESKPLTSAPKMDERKARRKSRRRITLDDDRLDDFDEIIDLDNYSDDMDDTDNDDDDSTSTNDEADSARTKLIQEEQKTQVDDSSATKDQSDSSETWATRYYQTDDVQNVIKESKIQSEIRKRLRERQRQSKLNSSPKLNSPVDTTMTTDKTEEKIQTKPTGSVQEYLALKSATASNTDESVNTVTVKDRTSDDNVTYVSPERLTMPPEKDTVVLTTNNSTQELTTEILSTHSPEVQ